MSQNRGLGVRRWGKEEEKIPGVERELERKKEGGYMEGEGERKRDQ